MESTPLHCALGAIAGHYANPHVAPDVDEARDALFATVKLLLNAGADVNAHGICRTDTPWSYTKGLTETPTLTPLGQLMNDTSFYCNFFGDDTVLRMARLLLSRGAEIHWTWWGDTAEDHARKCNAEYYPVAHQTADFLASVRIAGGWKKYVHEGRVDLRLLHFLVERGRATPPPELVQLFSLPRDVFTVVLACWRSDRDVPAIDRL